MAFNALKETNPMNEICVTENIQIFDSAAFQETAGLLKEELAVAIDEFLEDAVAYIADIESGMSQKDAQKVSAASHTLKSNSKSFGFVAVLHISQSLNDLIHDGASEEDFKSAEVFAAGLRKAFRASEKKLREAVDLLGY